MGLTDRIARSWLVRLQDGPSAEVPTITLPTRRTLTSVAHNTWRLRRFLREEQIDVLHVHGSGCLLLAAAATRAMRNRPRLFFTWHDSGHVGPQPGRRGWALSTALACSDRLSASSSSVADRLSTACQGRPVSVFVNGVSERALPKRPPNAIPTILWAGRLVPAKGPDVLIHALASLPSDPPRRVLIAGAAPPSAQKYERELRSAAATTGREDDVTFLGWVDEIGPLLAEADIAAQSSYTEGLSLALLEQMMAGLAIVATDVGDTAEALDHGRCGLLIPPGDVEALTDALQRLIEDPDLRRRLGAAARDRALTHYSLGAMAERALAAYHEAMGRARS